MSHRKHTVQRAKEIKKFPKKYLLSFTAKQINKSLKVLYMAEGTAQSSKLFGLRDITEADLRGIKRVLKVYSKEAVLTVLKGVK